jgi:hypothetical protein
MAKDSIITLSVDEAGTPPEATFLFHVMVDGTVVASNQSLSAEESRADCCRHLPIAAPAPCPDKA